jgi:hypothetical protein
MLRTGQLTINAGDGTLGPGMGFGLGGGGRRRNTKTKIRITGRTSQAELGRNDIVRLRRIHPHLYLSSQAAAERVTGSNVSKFCVAGKPVSNYMRADYAALHGTPGGHKELAASQSYIVAADTLMMSQAKFDKVFRLAARFIEDAIHDRPTLVHCHAGINRSTTAIIAWWIIFGQHAGKPRARRRRAGDDGEDTGTDTDEDTDTADESDETGETDESGESGESDADVFVSDFQDWTQVRDYIRKMNRSVRGAPALINPRFEDLLHGFARRFG